ncbi:caspase-6-like isoform X2 [Onthophagus taurus]|uniref:caspase-6-like isoform X2 n=1 Tax=Onthophagus taurus TaxID=166361 RepID=UPI000C20DFCF|nr:caspase-2-like isoform X2 [Onthophagus taurus]
MEQEHKDILRKNHTSLMKMNFNAMYPKLVENKVFTRELVDYYKGLGGEDGKRQLLFALDGRGPNAFKRFISCLRQTNQYDLVNKLSGIHTTVYNNTIPLHEPVINTEPEHIEIKVHIANEFKDDFSSDLKPYTMRNQFRGAVLIINNTNFSNKKERRGAEIDQQKLVQLFTQMGGYNLVELKNLTNKELTESIQNFVTNPILKSANVCFLFIMSHGLEMHNESYVECVNGVSVSTTWIENQFYRDNCPYMQNKPKIIVYQICRGLREDNVVKLMDNLEINEKQTEIDGTANVPVRNHSDMLVCHSTTKGYTSHRHTAKGSWYIQSICKVFMLHAWEYDVERLLHMVDKELSMWQSEVNRTMQTTGFYNSGFRLCYLNPGIYEHNGHMHRFDQT